jgi:hypothetical protein
VTRSSAKTYSGPSPDELPAGTADADLSSRTAAMLSVRGCCGCGTDEAPTLSADAALSSNA